MERPVAPAHITLLCVICDAEWTVKRRYGRFPEVCPECRRTDRPMPSPRRCAAHLAEQAVAHGVDATFRWHPVFGWSVWARTPWHDRRVHLTDRADLYYLTSELGAAA